MDLKFGLKRFWPNRTHESSVLKDAICALGFHRWHLIEVKAVSPALKCNYRRWCSEIRCSNPAPMTVRDLNSPKLLADSVLSSPYNRILLSYCGALYALKGHCELKAWASLSSP